jgi:hypothetical protein
MEMSNMVKPTIKTTIKPREDAATAGWKALFETFSGALDAMVAFSPCTPSREQVLTNPQQYNHPNEYLQRPIIDYEDNSIAAMMHTHGYAITVTPDGLVTMEEKEENADNRITPDLPTMPEPCQYPVPPVH